MIPKTLGTRRPRGNVGDNSMVRDFRELLSGGESALRPKGRMLLYIGWIVTIGRRFSAVARNHEVGSVSLSTHHTLSPVSATSLSASGRYRCGSGLDRERSITGSGS